MEHEAMLLPDLMFWWGYNADDPHPLVAVSSSQRGKLGSAPPCIQWSFPNFIWHNNVKYARWGTNYLFKIHQIP